MSPARTWLRPAVVGACMVALASPALADPDAGHDIEVPDRVDVTAGEPFEVSLAIIPASGLSISSEGPLRIEVSAPDDRLELPRRRYRRDDAADPRARAPRFDLRMKATEAGSLELVVEAAFWVCRRRICWPVAETRRVAVVAEAPAGADSPPE